MNGLLFRTRAAVLWVAVAVGMSGSMLLFLYAPGAVEEMLGGTMEGEELSDAWTLLFALLLVIPLVMAAVSSLASHRVACYVSIIVGLAYGLIGASASFLELLGGHFDGHVVMGVTAGVFALLIAGLGVVELRRSSSQDAVTPAE